MLLASLVSTNPSSSVQKLCLSVQKQCLSVYLSKTVSVCLYRNSIYRPGGDEPGSVCQSVCQSVCTETVSVCLYRNSVCQYRNCVCLSVQKLHLDPEVMNLAIETYQSEGRHLPQPQQFLKNEGFYRKHTVWVPLYPMASRPILFC